MLKQIPFSRFLILAVLALILAIICQNIYYFMGKPNVLVRIFQQQFLNAEDELNKSILITAQLYNSKGIEATRKHLTLDQDRLFEKKGIIIHVYENDTLKLWSENHLMEFNPENSSQFVSKLFVSNGYYYLKEVKIGRITIIGFLLIKKNFQVNNDLIPSEYHNRFFLPEAISIGVEPSKYKINNRLDRTMFYLTIPKNFVYDNPFRYCSIVFYFGFVVFLLIFLYQQIANESDTNRKIAFFLVVSTLLVFVKAIMILFHQPSIFFTFDIFKPVYFASSEILPSLGDLLITSGFAVYLVLILCNLFEWNYSEYIKHRWVHFILFFILLTGLSGYFHFLNQHFRSIIFNSTLNFEIHEIVKTNYLSLLGLSAIGLWYASFILLVNKLVSISSRSKLAFWAHLSITFSLVFVYVIHYQNINLPNIVSVVVIVLTVLLLSNIYRKKEGRIRYVYLYVLILLFSIYIVNTVNDISNQKTTKAQKLLAYNLASEKDIIAEYFLTEIDLKLQNDSILFDELSETPLNYNKIYNYLKKQYFTGYFDKYDLQTTICGPNDMLTINPGNQQRYCYGYFQQLINNIGFKLPKTSFYYLDFSNGRVSYFWKHDYQSKNFPEGISIFIQLDSRLIFDRLGYPELLLDKKYKQTAKELGFSYAKYFKGKLVSQVGDFQYSIFANNYRLKDEELFYINYSGFNHLFYQIDSDNMLIVSKHSIRFIDLLVSFLYMFLFFFVSYNLLFIKRIIKEGFRPTTFNFKNKIEISFVSILLISLVVVAIISVIYSFRYFKIKHKEIVTEKMQSVYTEIFQQFEYEKKISPDWSSSDYESIEIFLRKLSNVFYSDINLYSPEGKLIAGSRPEVFSKGLQGNLMDQMAIYQLLQNLKAEYTQIEKIGNLEYLSVYTPLTNNTNELIGYINIPYFVKQKEFNNELSTMLITILNFYVFLMFIALSVAVFISNKITQPLLLLQAKLSGIKLGKENLKLHYKGKDEIAGLVNEYNRMVDELDKNLELLAKTEREAAWSEMAKQIAHEIKNPLTPMKLSVQYLQKSLGSDEKNWPENFKRVSKTIIDQIDNLSSIATEFSNFAKLPKLKLDKLDLIEQIKKSVNLFWESGVEFKLNYDISQDITIRADHEQLQRVFINLFTNSIQAITPNQKGLIKITVVKTKPLVKIFISDNGVGIPGEIKEKLFQPNFTTKSGGMGLGLAIVKSIVESLKGSIYFESMLGEGTTFIITFTLFEDQT